MKFIRPIKSYGRVEILKNIARREIDEFYLDRIIFSFDLTMKNGLRDWLINNCHLAIGPLGFTAQGMSSLANKVVEAWEMQIPVITQLSIPIRSLKLEDCIIPISTNKKTNLSNEINMFIKEYECESPKIIKMIEKAFYYYQDNHSLKSFKLNFNKILNLIHNEQ